MNDSDEAEFGAGGRRHGIVVGVDDEADAGGKLAWAAEEAAARRVALHLVTAYRRSPILDEPGTPICGLASAETILTKARARSAAHHPELAVTAAAWSGTPVSAFLHEAEGADLLVVGSGRRGPDDTRLGTLTKLLAGRASCPLVVVHPGPDDARVEWPGPTVVGIDGSTSDDAVLTAAFEAAARRHGPLRIIHAYGGVNRASARAAPDHARESETDWLCRWARAYPEVRIDPQLVRDLPVRALLTSSAGSGLLVVGARGGGGFPSLLLGSVAGAVLRQARCPVEVVPVH